MTDMQVAGIAIIVGTAFLLGLIFCILIVELHHLGKRVIGVENKLLQVQYEMVNELEYGTPKIVVNGETYRVTHMRVYPDPDDPSGMTSLIEIEGEQTHPFVAISSPGVN